MNTKRALKIYLSSNCRNFVNQLLDKISTEDVNEHFNLEIISSDFKLLNKRIESPLTRKAIDQFFLENAKTFDIFLFDLKTSSIEHIHTLIGIIKNQGDLRLLKKKLILISDILTWENTIPFFEKNANDEKSVEEEEDLALNDGSTPIIDENIEKEQQEEEDNQIEISEKEDEGIEVIQKSIEPTIDQKGEDEMTTNEQSQTKYFTETDFMHRLGKGKYLKFIGVENMAFFLMKSCPNLTVNVLCPGVLYGNKDSRFDELFRLSLLQEPENLEYSKTGKNEIPLIHISDLMMHIKFLIFEETSKYQYIFATDRSKKRFQRQIIKSFAIEIGKGKITKKGCLESSIYSSSLKRVLDLDVRWQFGAIMSDYDRRIKKEISQQEEMDLGKKENGQEDQDEKLQDPNNQLEMTKVEKKPLKMVYDWKYKNGLVMNLKSIKNEFCKMEEFKTIKICVIGGPFTGKTTLSHQIARHYNIPLLSNESLISFFKSTQGGLGEELRTFIEEVKENEFNRLIEQREKCKRQNKTRIPSMPIKENIIPKISDELLLKMYLTRLRMNDCVNRGYVLDGYPTTFKMASNIFKS